MENLIGLQINKNAVHSCNPQKKNILTALSYLSPNPWHIVYGFYCNQIRPKSIDAFKTIKLFLLLRHFLLVKIWITAEPFWPISIAKL